MAREQGLATAFEPTVAGGVDDRAFVEDLVDTPGTQHEAVSSEDVDKKAAKKKAAKKKAAKN
jgi:hypothetical protein